MTQRQEVSIRTVSPASRFLLSVITLASCASLLVVMMMLSQSPSRAQSPQDEDDIVRVNTDLVVLNVTVTDKDGKYVHKLVRGDFKVLEDGREQSIANFSVEETPFAAALLLDTSGSMQGRMSLARGAAIRFLDGLRENDVAAIYRFDSEVEQLQDFSPGRDLPPMAYGVRTVGLTALNDAIVRAAIDLSQRSEQRRAIIVLSDGADTRSRASTDKALNAALAANATIYTVDLSDPQTTPHERMQGVGALRNFATKSGGRFVSTPGGKVLSDAFTGIVEELSNQYTIGYQSTNRARDGRWREIQIAVARTEANARTRRGYRAAKASSKQ